MPTSELALEKFSPDSRIGDLPANSLRPAIASAARGLSLDRVRAQIVERAALLKRSGLLPDNWNADGSLKTTERTWSTDEQRETWSDLYTGLQSALNEKFEDEGSYFYVWVQDLTATSVIFCMGGDIYSAPYTVEAGGPITIGDHVKVRPVTEYVGAAAERAAAGLERRKMSAELRKSTLERREISGLEVRSLDDGTIRMTGYGSVTEHPYEIGGGANGFVETVKRGAFKRTLSENPDVVLLFGHEGMPVARTKNATLALTEDAHGLKWTADLDGQDDLSRALSRKVDQGLIDQCSFAFIATDQEWSDDFTQRSIKSVSLHRGDISLVTQGANEATSVSLRSSDGMFELRSGREISAANATELQAVLDRIARADVELDAAQPQLAAILSVPNPDVDEPGDESDDAPAARALPLPDFTRRARQRLTLLEGRGR